MSLLQRLKIEDTQNDQEQRVAKMNEMIDSCIDGRSSVNLHGILECSKAFNLNTERQVAELCVGEENDEEHNREPGNVTRAFGQCFAQLCHGLVEADVFEHFDPGQEDGDADDDVELILPVAQEREVAVLVLFVAQQIIQ